MIQKLALTITLLLAAAGAWAQSPAPTSSLAATPSVISPDPNISPRVISGFGRYRNAGAAQAQLAARERLQETQSRLNDMRASLKRMEAEYASSPSKCPISRANLEVYELLLRHLDKEFQVQVATAARTGGEVRRAALYNQAFINAAAELAAAGQTPPALPTSVDLQPK
jgi:TolA-binding protein